MKRIFRQKILQKRGVRQSVLLAAAISLMTPGFSADVLAAEAVVTEAADTEAAATETAATETADTEAEVTVEYGNLRQLVSQGNLTLSQTIGDYADTISSYQDIWDTLKWEQSKMETGAEDLEDSDPETAAVYSSNASMLKSSASMIYSQLDRLTGSSGTKSLETAADTYTITAQTMMNSYCQLQVQAQAQEKRTQAAQASLQAARQQYASGLMTAEELKSEEESCRAAETSLASLKEQVSQSETSFLTFLGLSGQAGTVIGFIPEPDLEAIASIDFETDKEKAVNNSSTVISTRHESAPGSAAKKLRADRVAEAEGTEAASITASYENLQAKLVQYRGALRAWDSAVLLYQSLERKNQAGMLSNTQYLEGIADYWEALAEKEIASMNLVQAYESYTWEVKGRS